MSFRVERLFGFLNEAPKPRLRRFIKIQSQDLYAISSMKLRSRDFGDQYRRFIARRRERSSMKLRSRDFGDRSSATSTMPPCSALLNEAPKPRLRRCRAWRISSAWSAFLNEAPKPRLRRYAAQTPESDGLVRSSMKLRSRDFGDHPFHAVGYDDLLPQ